MKRKGAGFAGGQVLAPLRNFGPLRLKELLSTPQCYIFRSSMVQEHPIRVAARRTGLSPHVIRIWEKRYRAVLPRRSPTRRRFYTDEDIERLLLLRRATLLGRSIGQVAALSRDELLSLLKADALSPGPAEKMLSANIDIEPYVELCMQSVQGLDSKELEVSLTRASTGLSQPVFIEKFIVRLMERMGECWREGTMRVMHEHLLSSAVRSYLSLLGSIHDPPPSAPLLISTTPVGQFHEIGALATAATAASEGWRVLYLGPNLPCDEIAGAAQQQHARVVALSILYPPDDAKLKAQLVRLRNAIGAKVELIVGGRSAAAYDRTLRQIGAVLIEDFTSLRNHLEALRTERTT